jgi:hypothetical protein
MTSMSEILWYSRLALWTGAIVLVLESVTGRSAGWLAAIAVVLLLGGLVGLVVGLVSQERGPRTGVQASHKPSSVPEEPCGTPGGDHLSTPPITREL